MTVFRVGQRVRKARGLCVGLTGVVADIDPTDERSLGVRMDQGGIGLSGSDAPSPFSAGAIVYGRPDEHEPILPDGQRPADLSIHELLPFLKGKVPA